MNLTSLGATGRSATLLALLALNAAAGTLHVDLNSTNPVFPYSDWSTAATNIQDAVDVAFPGDLVLVNDGIYQTGGRVVYGALTNRLAVIRDVTVQSLSGPAVTVIQGYQVLGTTSGDSAIRCVYLTNGARLVGFTLTNGATRASGDWELERSGGGVWCDTNAVLSNCVVAGNSASECGGGAFRGTLLNCSLINNSAGYFGGGSFAGTLTNCCLTNNWAFGGGGVSTGALSRCTLSGNISPYRPSFAGGIAAPPGAPHAGGGAEWSSLENCVLVGNSANSCGGGAFYCSLSACTLLGNRASLGGGGACESSVRNSVIAANTALGGGGVLQCALSNCTVTANQASVGGGADDSTLFNCIVYYNDAVLGSNFYGGDLHSCCTAPAPYWPDIASDPQLVSVSHLSSSSPCRNAGYALYASGLDIDGEPWAASPSMGCDEFNPAPPIGSISVDIWASTTNVATGTAARFAALKGGMVAATRWELDDGTIVSNRPCVTRAWSLPGQYPVVLRAYNESYPDGVVATVWVTVGGPAARYVALGNTAPRYPYGSWATAATNLQDAVEAAAEGEEVLVTNGVYQTSGGTALGALSNRVAVTRPLVVRSVNGPGLTVIKGDWVPGTTNGLSAIRCVYLASGARLDGFTLTNGATAAYAYNYDFDPVTDRSGGGIWCGTNAVVINCIFSGNSTDYYGGGAYGGSLSNCSFISNSSSHYGGGACGGTLSNCTFIGNCARYGGGAHGGTLANCTLERNSATYDGFGGLGGGACSNTLYNCTLAANQADMGGGVYYGTASNCLITNNSAWQGGGAYHSTLKGCSIKGNSAWQGGGAFGSTLDSCWIAGNVAAGSGGGAYANTLRNCALVSNKASDGGGASSSTLQNCTVVTNGATATGGGCSGGTLVNCILYFNSAPAGPDYSASAFQIIYYCCTPTLPTSGAGLFTKGNFTNAPLFVELAGDLHLQSNSPCINSGANAYAPAGPDLDGNPRISGGTVDVGAYEFQNPASTIPYVWLQQYGLPMDATVDTLDSDNDGLNNWQEWRAGTDPTNAVSVLQILTPTNGPSGITVTWQSVTNRNYYLQRSVDLSAQPAFVNVQLYIVGQVGTTSYTDTNATGAGPFFYRVGVQ